MKKISPLILVLSLIAPFASYASEEISNQYSYPGQNGILLAWNGSWDVGVGTFAGGIGYKHWISHMVAFESFLTLGKTDENIFNEDSYPPEYRLREQFFSIIAGVENHFWTRGRLSFMFGGGFLLRASNSRFDYVEDYPYEDELKQTKTTQNVYGLQSNIGLEYFFTKNLSLSGQYQMNFSLEKKTDKFIYWSMPAGAQPQKQKTTTWSIGLSTSLLMLTIYL